MREELEADLRDLRDYVSQLERNLAAMERDLASLPDLQSRIEELESEVESLSADLEEERRTVASLEEKLESIEERPEPADHEDAHRALCMLLEMLAAGGGCVTSDDLAQLEGYYRHVIEAASEYEYLGVGPRTIATTACPSPPVVRSRRRE